MYIIKVIIFELFVIYAYGELNIADFVLPKNPNALFLEKLKKGEINFERDLQLGLGFNISEIFNIREIFQNYNPNDYFKKDGKFQLPRDFGLDIYKFLKNHGYPVETHWVQTEDGYVLRMHRVAGRNGTKGYMTKRDRPAVLLMHGLTSSSFHWVVAGPNKSLALQLADQGFDVWLGNTRGNTWSRQHKTLNPDIDPEFWQFSYEKCGQYDLPAKIDYIIAKTGQQKIFYVGHSQGTSIFFAMAALRPKYNDKIVLYTALAPVVYLKHMSSPIYRLLVNYMDKIEVILKNVNELMSYNWLSSRILGLLCSMEYPFSQICLMPRFFFSGFDPYQVNQTQIAIETAQSPNGISKTMIIHYGQNLKSGLFQRFDYGPELNKKHYQSSIPPNFTLSHVTVPTALYYAQNDLFVPVEAAERLSKELPNVVKSKLISYKYFNHMDFVNAVDVNELVNNDVISLIKKYVDNGGTTTPASPPGSSAASTKFNYECTLMIILSACFIFLVNLN